MALTLQPIRGVPQHSGETGTPLTTAIHRRLFSRFFSEGGETSVHRARLYLEKCIFAKSARRQRTCMYERIVRDILLIFNEFGS